MPSNMKKMFVIKAKVEIHPQELNLPDEFPINEWHRLAYLSNLKNSKRWTRNKRLRKRFCKYPKRYLPNWVLKNYSIINGTVKNVYNPIIKTAANEIRVIEDKIILEKMKKIASNKEYFW